MDTIFALATARGRAGIAVVRLSGPAAHEAVRCLAGDVPQARRASVRLLRRGDDVLDQAVVLTFEAGASFTGEAMAELQLHGSVAVTASVLQALSEVPGLRLAEPGEFTRRALENGRLDLAQVEGLADLIDSETEAQRKQAYRVLSGAVGAMVEVWRKRLIRAAALLEASIDFADEDVPVDVTPEVRSLIGDLLIDMRREVDGARISERVRDGFEVAIVGRPNAGKSTLLNYLAGRDAALTSAVAGTTRDVVEVRMELAGLPVTLLDTAGLRETDDHVEGLGVARALRRAEQADLRIFLLDDAGLPDGLDPQGDDIVVFGKADLRTGEAAVSGATGAGVDRLVAMISERLSERVSNAGTLTRLRHRRAVAGAIGCLEKAQVQLEGGGARMEIAAEFLRHAIRDLDTLTGRIDVEDLLGEIFSSFCIGK